MTRLWIGLAAVLLLGAADPWIDASSQDLNGYVRALSLDLRGVVPTEAELTEIEEEGHLSETILDVWLASPEFETVVVGKHQELFWNNLEINLLNTRRLVNRDGIVTGIPRSRYTRGVPQTECLDYEADVDSLNRPLSWETNPDDSRSEGWVWVTPYWAPDTPMKVCAYDAQLTEYSAAGPHCSTPEGHMESDCGCGPNLQWCFHNSEESTIEEGISGDLDRRVRGMLQTGTSYTEMLTGSTIYVNGPTVHFYRHIAQFAPDNYESPIPLVTLPEIDYADQSFVPVTLEDYHDGIFTSPGWLLRHQTNRGRANRFYSAFLCSEFIPAEEEVSGLTGTVVPSPDLQMREGCLSCHARLEPWAAYWGRWNEAAAIYRSADAYPAYLEECAMCATAGTACSDFCEDNYLVESSHSDELPYLGWLNTYAFLEGDKSAHPDLGPLGWVLKSQESGDFSQCGVTRAADWLLNWDSNPENVEAWAEDFAADDDYRAMVKRIVMSGPYWGGAE